MNPSNTVDLHGLLVEEAKEKVKELLQNTEGPQHKQIRLIVGKASDPFGVG